MGTVMGAGPHRSPAPVEGGGWGEGFLGSMMRYHLGANPSPQPSPSRGEGECCALGSCHQCLDRGVQAGDTMGVVERPQRWILCGARRIGEDAARMEPAAG